ncbi:MAG: histidinol-phosphate transaminase [Actinobacteria bacterium]|nr:histidinol-phosphate transaminase [Actinomycetota bacterium]
MTKLPIRKDLIGRTPYGAPQIDVPVRLNTNENPFGPSPELVAELGKVISELGSNLNRYPDRDATELRGDLAKYLNAESKVSLTAANIWPANGSNEVMQQLLQLFGGPEKSLVAFDPTYSMYEDYCRNSFTTYISISRNEDFTIDKKIIDKALSLNPDIVVLTSPNNPTGTIIEDQEIDYLLKNFSGVLLVDEAYAEFRPLNSPSALSRLEANPNLVVVRTMSKAFSFAGARVGYAAANPEVIEAIQLVRLPYHLSSVTQAVAKVALKFSDQLQSQVNLLRQERDELAIWLVNHGFEVAPSGANFLLFGTFGDRNQVWEQLVEHGVLIRQTGPSGWLRVSIGTPKENLAFKTALLDVTNRTNGK